MRKYIGFLSIIVAIFLFVFNTAYTPTSANNNKHVNTPGPSGTGKAPEKGEKPVPVLAYHLVSDDLFSSNTELFAKPKEFEEQLKWITAKGYIGIFADGLSEAGNVNKPIIISFDDGYIDNYEIVFPLIKKYNLKITIFIITDMIDTQYHLKTAQLKEMYESGLVSIQSHTVTHPHLTKLGTAELDNELLKSKAAIFTLTGSFPTAIAYPYGDVNEKVAKAASKYYWTGYSTSAGNLSTGNKFTIKRFEIGRSTPLSNIQKYLDTFK